MAKRKITKRTVDALKPGELVWDADVRGFAVRRQRNARVYLVKYRFGNRQRWYTIGEHGSPWTVEKARTKAKAVLGDVADKFDPAALREAERNRGTVAELCDRFLEDYATEHKRPGSVETDRANIQNHVKPLLGKLHVADVTRADIDQFKRAVKDGKTARDTKRGPRSRSIVTGGPGVANRCLALLSKMLNLAERWGWRPEGSNPCRHVDKYRENRRERFLAEAELARLGDILIEAERSGGESPYAVAAIRLLVFTGARRGEILGLRWEHVDIERAMLLLPDSKTGAKAVYLSAPALEVLTKVPRMENNPFVIAGEREGAALVNLQRPWRRIRARAGLEDVRLHDLRHSFASVGASGGLSLPMIGRLLGHTQAATTQRYAHLAADPIRAANEAIGERIARMMKGDANASADGTSPPLPWSIFAPPFSIQAGSGHCEIE
jgi:integrase